MRSEKSLYTNEVMIPLNMFFFMTCRSCWLSVLFHEDFCFVLHTTEVSGVGSNISICLACFLQTELHHSQFIHCDHQQLEHRKQASNQRSFLVVMDRKLSSSLISTVTVSPSWVKKEEKLALTCLADSKQGRLFAHVVDSTGILPW